METINQVTKFLPKPTFKNLTYVHATKPIYVNLFDIKFKNKLTIFKYPYHVDPELAAEDMSIRDKIFKYLRRKLLPVYKECFHSGDMLYSLEKVTEMQTFEITIFANKKEIEYHVTIQPFANEVVVDTSSLGDNDQIAKQCIELILRDILHSNPNLDFYRNLMVNKSERKNIAVDRISIDFYPGFTTSYMLTTSGPFLNVTLKNKILSTQTILETIQEMRSNKKTNNDIINDLIGRSFKVKYSNKNFIIDDMTFDKTPENTTFLRDGHNIGIINYYKEAHGITIKDKKQPLILVKRKGPQEQETTLYFVPELCYLSGLDDAAVKNGRFMKELANYTKLLPHIRINQTNKFLQLLENENRKQIEEGGKVIGTIPSSFEKKKSYGIDINPVKTEFKAQFMKEPTFSARGNRTLNLKNKVFEVSNDIIMNKWLCLYDKRNYNDADLLYKTLSKACTGFRIKIEEPEWVEMTSNKPDDWTGTVDDYFNESKYQFVLFLLDRNDRLYAPIKKHSLMQRGYHSQVVKTFSLKKNAMSVCSKILLQLNAKLGGCAYNINFDSQITNKNLMIVGVDSSHIKGRRTGVAMVASISSDFNSFYNKETIIDEKNKNQLQYSVSTFLEKAIQEFFKKNKTLPGGIVIYRQGVSLQQKDYLENEANAIHNLLTGNQGSSSIHGKNIPYYYVLVNTKTTYKFFEKQGNKYSNPETGLLVHDGVTNKDFFEFYIQPQEVTGGSATPTCYHVAYGTMNTPEFLPKFTYDLCYIYANWPGPVRVPNVLKAAEKLSKMTAKYTNGELHQNLSIGQSYL